MSGDVLLLKANLLEAAGRRDEVEKALNQGLHQVSTKPRVVQPAVLLLLRLGRKTEALALLEQAILANPLDADLLLLKAMVLGLMNQFAAAEKTIKEVELSWPEWDRAYLAHGLLLERFARPVEARQKLQIVTTLGSQDLNLQCALARLAGKPKSAPECSCLKGLEQLLFPNCGQRP
jgi:tetratricopeptide (TPR) repeat protein